MTEKGRRALAEAIKNRRQELGLGQGDLGASGGPSIVTVGQLEREQIENPQPTTLKRLDTALRWEPGTAAEILAGRKVTRADRRQPTVMEAIERDTALLPEARAHLLNQYQLLLRISASEEIQSVPVEEEVAEVQPLRYVARKRANPRKRQP